MTREEWAKTCRYTDDLPKATGLPLGAVLQSGYIYDPGFIEILEDGRLFLLVYNQDWVRDNTEAGLKELEHKLWEEFVSHEVNR